MHKHTVDGDDASRILNCVQIETKKKYNMLQNKKEFDGFISLTQSFESDLGLLNVWILSPRRDWTIACTAFVLNIFTYFSSSFLSLTTRFDIFGLMFSIVFAEFIFFVYSFFFVNVIPFTTSTPHSWHISSPINFNYILCVFLFPSFLFSLNHHHFVKSHICAD